MRAFAKATAKDLQGAFFGVGAAGAAATRLLDHLSTDDDIAEWLDDKGWHTFESLPFSRPAERSMGATQIARALQGFNSSKAGSKVWNDEEMAARPGRLLRVEGLLRAVTEEFHRQDDTDADPEFVVRLLLRQAASWHQQHVHAQQRVRFFILKLAKFRRDYKKTWQRFPDFDMAEYQAALPRRFATFSPLEISARTARTSGDRGGPERAGRAEGVRRLRGHQ